VIDPARFRPQPLTGGKTIRIAWMSRKNKALAEQIMQITGGMDQDGMDQGGMDQAASPSNRPTGKSPTGRSRVEWVEIRNMTPDEVAKTLASCHIFLSTGFPEGCPLPPLEAMASGCLVVGFTGYGGWDYMRQASPGQYAPRIALRPVPWGGNGLYAPDGDVLEASFLLHAAITMVRENAPEYAGIREQAMLTATAYSIDAQREDVRAAWDMLENSPHG
jgi:Glycosyltransferase